MEKEWSEGRTLANPRFLTGVVFFVSVLLAITWLAIQVSDWLKDEQQLPVQHILVAGDRQYIQDKEIEKTIRETQSGSFFELDIDEAHVAVESLPWIYRASLRKEWPNTLKVYVVEQVPVAHWNDDLLLNQYGGTFQTRMPEEQDTLPLLFGPGGSELTALEGYRAMQGLLDNSGLKIAELLLSERYAWHIRLRNGVKLRLGRSEFIGRLQRFIDLYPLLDSNEKGVDYVDLRYDTGLAVGWTTEK